MADIYHRRSFPTEKEGRDRYHKYDDEAHLGPFMALVFWLDGRKFPYVLYVRPES